MTGVSARVQFISSAAQIARIYYCIVFVTALMNVSLRDAVMFA